jgi:hypothetical protein
MRSIPFPFGRSGAKAKAWVCNIIAVNPRLVYRRGRGALFIKIYSRYAAFCPTLARADGWPGTAGGRAKKCEGSHER